MRRSRKMPNVFSLSRTDTLSFPSRLHVFTNNPRGKLLESWRYDLIAKYVFSVLAAERSWRRTSQTQRAGWRIHSVQPACNLVVIDHLIIIIIIFIKYIVSISSIDDTKRLSLVRTTSALIASLLQLRILSN